MTSPIRSVNYSVIKRREFGYTDYTHPDWTIYVVISGAFCCSFSDKEDLLQEGDLYIIPPNVPFHRHVTEELTVHFLRFEPGEMPFPIPTGKHRVADLPRLQGTLQMMRQLSKSAEPSDLQLLHHLLFDLLCQCYYERERAPQSLQIVDKTVIRVLDFFHEHYAEKLNMSQIATRFSLSPSGLIFKFRRATGDLPARALLSIRLKAAKKLLVDTSLSLAEIAERTGFENAYYFSTVFKKEVGLPPSQYRKTYLI